MSSQLPPDMVIAIRRLSQALGDPKELLVNIGQSIEAALIEKAAELLLRHSYAQTRKDAIALLRTAGCDVQQAIAVLKSDDCESCDGTGSGGMGVGCTDCLGTGLAAPEAPAQGEAPEPRLVGYDECRCILTQYCDGKCRPIFRALAAPEAPAQAGWCEGCTPENCSGCGGDPKPSSGEIAAAPEAPATAVVQVPKALAPIKAWQIFGMDGDPLFIQQDEASALRYKAEGHRVEQCFICSTPEAPATAVVQMPTLGQIMAVAKAIHRTEPDPDLPSWDELRQHDIDVLRGRAEVIIRALATPEAPAQECGLCGADQPFTGSCGGGRDNPRALCFAAPEAPAREYALNPADVHVQVLYKSEAGFSPTVENGVRLTHMPTGIYAECQSEMSKHANREAAWKLLERKVAAKTSPYYISGPYTTGEHAGEYGVAEVNTGRIVHFFKPCEFPTCAPHHPCTKPCFRNSGEKST